MKEKAFTLAEVLITLGIIGIVAAITLPVLTKKYQEKILVTQLKRSYSDLENALRLYATTNSCSDISCISDTSTTTNELTQKLYQQFTGAKYCEVGNKSPQCINVKIKGNTPVNDGYGNTIAGDTFRKPYFITKSNSAYQVIQYSECPRKVISNKRDENGNFIIGADGKPETTTNISNVCATFYIDTNGTLKGPNQFGADIFKFDLYYDGKFKPNGIYFGKTITTGKLYYTPYNIGTEIKK